MRASPIIAALFATLVLCMTAASAAAAQTDSKPLFTHRPWLCIGRGFVAMVPLYRPQPLIVIKISSKGIEAPQTLPTTGNEVHGLQCVGSDIELLVQEAGSDHFSVLPFSVKQSAVKQEQREDINWPLGKVGTPPDVERRMEAFHGMGRAGDDMTGNWYIQVPSPEGRPGHIYKVHFVETETGSPRNGLAVTLVVNLFEETLDRKVTQTVPLIREEVSVVYD